MPKSKQLSDIVIIKNNWEARYKNGWGGGRDFVFENFLKKYKTKLGPRILDIGSGEGRHVLQLAQAGFDTVGLELTKYGNETALKQLQNRKLRATLVLGDAHQLPFIDGYFDSVISIQVFQFNNWKGAEICFAEASRILKKNGIFFLRVKATSAEVPKENIQIKNDHGATYKTPEGNMAHFYTEDELVSLGSKYGYKIIEGPFDDSGDGKKGQWNVVYKKILTELFKE